MANKFIYFLIIVLAHSKPNVTYFLNDDLETNLPDRFGDPIDENWQDKRSASNEYSSLSKTLDNFPDVNKESTDFDYINGNAETQANDEVELAEKLHKREMEGSINEPLNEADIRQILSQFSRSDHDALDGLMNDDRPKIDVDKRQLLKRNFEHSFHLNNRNNFKAPCKGLRCDEYDQIPMSNELILEENGYHCPEKVSAKRKLKFKRSNHSHSPSRENILQSKISLLKDNYKRSSEMRSREDSANKRYNKKKRKLDNDFHGRYSIRSAFIYENW